MTRAVIIHCESGYRTPPSPVRGLERVPRRAEAGLPRLGPRERPAFASRRLTNATRPLDRNVAANADGRGNDTIAMPRTQPLNAWLGLGESNEAQLRRVWLPLRLDVDRAIKLSSRAAVTQSPEAEGYSYEGTGFPPPIYTLRLVR